MADDSDSSGLSEHDDKEIQRLAPIFQKAKSATKLKFPPPVVSPPRPKRPPSPPHEEVLADNGDIAFIVMFRSRFNDALPSKLPHYGPQDVERGVIDSTPSKEVEQMLCALLGLVLNRKKPVERGHHGRALEEAVQTQKPQWPWKWNGVNPLHGGKSFDNMTPIERLDLLRTLVIWALSSSEAIQTILKEKFKQQRHSDDENQPLSVQPWGIDGDKRRYFLVQGLEDTSFRVYREGSRYTKNAHWYSVAGDIDEVKALAKKLEEVDGSQAARRLAGRVLNAVPTFEATEEKRRKKEQRQMQRARFTRPEPGFSLYEGRTRGKRMRYTYDDDEDVFDSDATSTRRSTRHSGRSTPFETGPTTTASGRQIRQPRTGEYGESLLSGPPISTDELAPEYSDGPSRASHARSGTEDSEDPVRKGGRASRSGGGHTVNGASNPRKRKHIDGFNDSDDMSDEEDARSDGDGWDSEKNESENERMPDVEDGEDGMSEADEVSEDEDAEPQSLVVKLKVSPKGLVKINGMQTPATAFEGSTQPGALKPENTQEAKTNAATNGVEHTHQPLSSPNTPSAYPTPTSSSFLPKDQKAAVASAPAVSQPAFAARPIGHGHPPGVPTPLSQAFQTNELHNEAQKPESNNTGFEGKPMPFVHHAVNGIASGESNGYA